MFDHIVATTGALCLGICPIPQTWKCFQTGKAEDISWAFLLLWFIGDICLLYYGIVAHLPIAIVLNNVLNALCISVIAYHK